MIARHPMSWRLGGNPTLILVLALVASPALAQTDEAARRHRVELLGLFVTPTDDVVDDVYGSHAGFAVRYALRVSPKWGLEVELGQRQAEGSTGIFGFPADLEVLHGTLLGAYHWGPGVAQPGRWTVSLGAGILFEDVEEEVRFPDELATASETLLGGLLRAGLRWPVRPAWGLTAETRLSLLEDSSPPESGVEPANLGALELAAGVFVAF